MNTDPIFTERITPGSKLLKIAIVGAGNMGGAVALGVGDNDDFEVRVSNPSPAKLTALSEKRPGIHTFQSNKDCVRGADVVVLAVKPWKVEEVMTDVAGSLHECKVLVSLVGGSSARELSKLTGDRMGDPAREMAFYHVIPNTAASLGESMTFVNGINTSDDTDNCVRSIFDCIGMTRFVEEFQMNAGMAVASCGIAFMMRYMRAMTEAGVELGLRPHEALEAVAMTMKGAADLILENGTHPEQEVDKVTTAGGITIRGLNAMEEAGLSGAIIRGVRACIKK